MDVVNGRSYVSYREGTDALSVTYISQRIAG
jgi:hypothetical protein